MKGWIATKAQDGVVENVAAKNFPFIDEGVDCDEGARRGSRKRAAKNFPFIDEGVDCDEGARRGSRSGGRFVQRYHTV